MGKRVHVFISKVRVTREQENTEKPLAAAPVGSKAVILLLLLHNFVPFIVLLSSF